MRMFLGAAVVFMIADSLLSGRPNLGMSVLFGAAFVGWVLLSRLWGSRRSE
jgi:cell division protein FtsW (lipid II flippase)